MAGDARIKTLLGRRYLSVRFLVRFTANTDWCGFHPKVLRPGRRSLFKRCGIRTATSQLTGVLSMVSVILLLFLAPVLRADRRPFGSEPNVQTATPNVHREIIWIPIHHQEFFLFRLISSEDYIHHTIF